VCLLTDVMFVCRLMSCLSTDLIIRIELYVVMKLFVDWRHVCQLMKLQTGTPGHKWRPGHREYKWRTGHSKRNYRLGHRDTNNDRDTGNINDDRDTGPQLQRGPWGGYRGIYKRRRGHRECSISNHHQQSSRPIIRIMRYRSEFGLFFFHGQLYVASSRVGKPDNLCICTDNGTAKNIVYSQVLCS